jgi:peptide/nickel transport system ATP-binding protein
MPHGVIRMENIVEVKEARKYFTLRGSFLEFLRGKKTVVKAVDGVSFEIKQKEIVGIVGESGSGKTTLGKIILNLIPCTSGKIFFNGIDVNFLKKREKLKFRREAQIILQDPFGSLNPSMRVFDLISESIDIHKLAKDKSEKRKMITEILEMCNLTPVEEIINKYPNELSGGQMQRVCIARALVLNPKFIVCDEPVSMLDASIKANILNLLIHIRDKFNVSQLFITHDVASARYISDRILIMYLGKIVEAGSSNEIVSNPLHPYTQALLSAVLVPDPLAKKGKGAVAATGEIPNPINIPHGCRFHPRCPVAMNICRKVEPELEEKNGHLVACHMV